MNVIEIDAASNNGVDNIREIREEVAYRPTEGRYKVYIIDEVHMLSIGAFNALLKTLEEPPEYVIFILATTEAHKIPITILSRCQRYDFKNSGGYGLMAKRGGFPGGGGMPGNMANLMKQAQKMQRQMEEQAKEMETKEFSATAGGGAVEATVSGTKQLVKISLNEEVVDPDDIEMLEDLIVAAVNEALEKVDEASASAMSKFTGGMGGQLPGLF